MERSIGIQKPHVDVGQGGGWFSETFKAYALVRLWGVNEQCWVEMDANTSTSDPDLLKLTYRPPEERVGLSVIKSQATVYGIQIQIADTGETVYYLRLDMQVASGDYITMGPEGDLVRLLKKIHDLSRGE